MDSFEEDVDIADVREQVVSIDLELADVQSRMTVCWKDLGV